MQDRMMEFSNLILTLGKNFFPRQMFMYINSQYLRHSTGLVCHLARNDIQLNFRPIKYFNSDTPYYVLLFCRHRVEITYNCTETMKETRLVFETTMYTKSDNMIT